MEVVRCSRSCAARDIFTWSLPAHLILSTHYQVTSVATAGDVLDLKIEVDQFHCGHQRMSSASSSEVLSLNHWKDAAFGASDNPLPRSFGP